MIFVKRVAYISLFAQKQTKSHFSPYELFQQGLQFCPISDVNPFKQAVKILSKILIMVFCNTR